MAEIYNFPKNSTTGSWFNRLMFSSEKIFDVSNDKNFDSSKMEVKLEVNGKEVLIADFNETLNQWEEKIEQKIKKQLDFYATEEGVKDLARNLLKEKLGNAYNILNLIEGNAWKIEVD